ncbi:MAG: glycosyltransferase family 4 protein [Lentisphaeria bacterium]|nr:glycosyltransferase family 4 protein [Lentisphaeria bacterium]
MTRKLKTCHIITRMIVGGAQENTLLTCRGHLEKGHEVTLLTGPSQGPEGKLLAAQNISELEVVEIPSLVRNLNLFKDARCYFELKRHFRENRYDVVHTHSSKAGVLGRMAAWSAGVPLIVHTVHGQAFHRYQSAFKNRIYILAERFAAKRCHRILAVAQAMIDQCVDAGVAPREKYKVVYSGMDMDAFLNAQPEAALRERLGIPEGVLVIGKIARLFELKGHDLLIEAAAKIVPMHPEVRFLLVGDGDLREQLEDDIRKRGLERNFVFAGLVPPSEVCRYTALMDILAHFSLREGLPRTVVQALASGIPAVGFDLDGTPEVLLNGKTGYVCEPENVQQVTNALVELLGDDEKRREMGRAGRELVREQFSWQRMADVIEQEFLDGLAGLGR